LDDEKKADYLVCVDLTYPFEISERLIDDFNGTLVLAEKCMHRFQELLKEKKFDGAQLSFHSNTHPWSSKEPWKPHLHHHLNFPNILQPNLARFWPWISNDREVFKRNALEVRELWGQAIHEVFGYGKVIAGRTIYIPHLPDVFIHALPLDDRPRLLARLKYCSRRPVADFFEFFGNGGELPDDLTLKELNFIKNVLYYENPRTHRGLNIATLVNALPLKGPRCPICHAPARIVERPPPEHFFEKGYTLAVWHRPGWLLIDLKQLGR